MTYSARDALRDLGGLAGLGLLGYGCWLHYPPLGFAVPGAVLVLGILLSAVRRSGNG